MKRSTFLYRLLACFLLSSTALAELPLHPALTPRKAAAMAKVAETLSDYEQLAAFYQQQERDYAATRAQQERVSEYAVGHWGSESYPQAADRARLLEEFYEQRRRQSKHLSELSGQKARGLHSDAAESATQH